MLLPRSSAFVLFFACLLLSCSKREILNDPPPVDPTQDVAQVEIIKIENITDTSAIVTASITSFPQQQGITSQGFQWSEDDQTHFNNPKLINGNASSYSMVISPLSKGSKIFVQPVTKSPNAMSFGKTLSFLTSGSASWHPVNLPALTCMASERNLVFAGTSNGFFVSSDSGQTFKNAGFTGISVKYMAIQNDHVFLGTNFGLFSSNLQGTLITNKDPSPGTGMAVLGNSVMIVSDTGFVFSADQGQTWRTIESGIIINGKPVKCRSITSSLSRFYAMLESYNAATYMLQVYYFDFETETWLPTPLFQGSGPNQFSMTASENRVAVSFYNSTLIWEEDKAAIPLNAFPTGVFTRFTRTPGVHMGFSEAGSMQLSFDNMATWQSPFMSAPTGGFSLSQSYFVSPAFIWSSGPKGTLRVPIKRQ